MMGPEQYAEAMAAHPRRESEWAIERIRVGVDDGYTSDADFRQLVRDVLAGYDLAERRSREDVIG